MARLNEPIIKPFINSKGYTYWIATITVMRKRYKKTFSYTEMGYNQAEAYIKTIQQTYYNDYLNN